MNKKFSKILVLASTFPNNDKDLVPSFVKDQIISMKKINPEIEFLVIAPSYSDYKNSEQTKYYKQIRYRYFFKKFEKLAGKGILPTIRKNYLYILLIPFFIFSQLLYVIKYSQKFKPDIIYSHWVMPQALISLIVYKIYKIPYVFSTHAHDAEVIGKIPIFGKIILNSIVKNSKAFTCDSKNTELKLKKYINKKYWDRQKSLIHPMGINSEEIDNADIEKVSNFPINKKTKITFVGRFAEKKGVELLLPAFKEVLKNHKNIQLILCGDGHLLGKYKNFISSNNLEDSIVILNFFNDLPKLKFVYKNSDIIVVPSVVTKQGDVEGLPLVILESLYLGKIVIASKQSNAEEVISDHSDGFIFDAEDKEGLVEVIEQILNNDYELNIIKKNALNVGKKYQLNKVSEIYSNHLFKEKFISN